MTANQGVFNYATKVLAWVFIISWLSQVVFLFPIPDLSKLTSSDSVEATKASGWVFTFLLIAFGAFAGYVALNRRVGVALMFVSSTAYVIVWWLYSGYFDVTMSFSKLFSDLWSVATQSGRMVIFMHRDVLLNVFYHAMMPILAYMIYRIQTAQNAG